jgi:hypothetical protein
MRRMDRPSSPSLSRIRRAVSTITCCVIGSRRQPLVDSFTHTAPYAAAAFLVCAVLSMVLPRTAVAGEPG